MKNCICFVIAGMLLLMNGMATGADIEVRRDFSVNAGSYYYTLGTNFQGSLPPRCLCDTTTGPAPDCHYPVFYTDVDQGSTCYDWVTTPGAGNFSYEFSRTAAATPSFWVTPNGDAYVPTPNTGIILKAPNGITCYRITVDNSGTMHSLNTACP